MSVEWHRVSSEDELAIGFRKFTVAGKKVVVGRLEGALYAFDALCPHAGGPMELSEVQGSVVSCPHHAWRFDLRQDGTELHGYRKLACIKVRVEQGSVYVAAMKAAR